MPLLSFPVSPVSGQLYPTSPLPGEPQYQWSAADNTWVLLGTATTVIPGCYGDGLTVPAFCVDAQGRLTSVINTPIPAVIPDLQTVTTQGAVTTDTIDVGGLVASGLTYPVADGTANQVVTTDGAGALGWLTTAEVVAVPGSSVAGGAANQVAFGGGFLYFHDGTQWWQVAGVSF